MPDPTPLPASVALAERIADTQRRIDVIAKCDAMIFSNAPEPPSQVIIAARVIDSVLRPFIQAVRATAAWFIAENSCGAVSFEARMDLCKYSEHLVKTALGMIDEEHSGVPRLIVWPEIRLERKTASDCERLIDETLALAPFRPAPQPKEDTMP